MGEEDEWRIEEFGEAKAEMEFTKQDSPQFADEVRSLANDAISPSHDRDYRSLVVFLADLMLKRNIAIRVVDMRHREEG